MKFVPKIVLILFFGNIALHLYFFTKYLTLFNFI